MTSRACLWAGTIPGGLFKSEDGGRSWQLNKPLWEMPERKQWFGGGAEQPGIHSICIDPRGSKRMSLAVSCGGVWLTENRGESWSVRSKGLWAEYTPPDQKDNPLIQDPHRMVQCAASPDSFWIQHHNGIFRCTNGLGHWDDVKDVKPSNFGFPVAVHPNDPDTAWFVPALDDAARYPVGGRVVVTRTRDGGKSFDVLADGLPQDNAYDLVYRHGLCIDETGERLAFGSTTGNLWITENGGDTGARSRRICRRSTPCDLREEVLATAFSIRGPPHPLTRSDLRSSHPLPLPIWRGRGKSECACSAHERG